MKKIVVLAASNNNNLNLAKEIEAEVKTQGAQPEVVDLTSIELPVYTPRLEEQGAPQEILKYVDLLADADGMAIVAPEYNGGIPPVLTNFIAWISRSGNEDWRQCFNGKKAIIGTHSGSGGLHLLMGLRMQLSYIGVDVIGRQLHTHYKKELNKESLTSVVGQLLK